jgi:hypothetical protein
MNERRDRGKIERMKGRGRRREGGEERREERRKGGEEKNRLPRRGVLRIVREHVDLFLGPHHYQQVCHLEKMS